MAGRFPNAPYILTDFLHLGSMGDIVPGWYDVLMLFWFAWTGLILGIVSLYLMQEIVTRGLGTAAGWVFVVVVAGLGSFGLYPAASCAGTAGTWCAVRGCLGRAPRPRHRSRLAAAAAGLHAALPLLFLFIYVAVYIFAKLAKPQARRARS